jgi:hypothetical protein
VQSTSTAAGLVPTTTVAVIVTSNPLFAVAQYHPPLSATT